MSAKIKNNESSDLEITGIKQESEATKSGGQNSKLRGISAQKAAKMHNDSKEEQQ